MLWLNRSHVEQLLDPVALTDLVAEGFCRLEDGRIVNGHEARLDIAQPKSNYVAFPALLHDDDVFSVKILTASDERIRRDLPLIGATIVLVDTIGGGLLCIMDGALITAARTAAITAAAFRAADGRGGTLCIVGTGIVARMHIAAMAAAGSFDRICIVSPSGAQGRAEELAASARAGGHEAAAAASMACLAEAEVVVTATNRRIPLAEPEAFARSRFIAVVGSCRPGATEIPLCLLPGARLIADWPERFRMQWRDAPDQIDAASLASVMALSTVIRTGGRAPEGRTVFLSAGMAFADAMTALHVYRKAIAHGVGQELR